jgi:hypothetical protein
MQQHIDDLTDADLAKRVKDSRIYMASVYTREIFEIVDDHNFDEDDDEVCWFCTMPNDEYFEIITSSRENEAADFATPLDREE